jgi:putative FmdB family regulatory protein
LEGKVPIYEYRCSSCAFQKEYLRKASDPLLSSCPECGKDTFQKMLTAAGFQLKGSGWYATDFKNNGAKPAKEKTGVSSTDGSKSEASKSDASKTDAPKTESAKPDVPKTGTPASAAGASSSSSVAESGS